MNNQDEDRTSPANIEKKLEDSPKEKENNGEVELIKQIIGETIQHEMEKSFSALTSVADQLPQFLDSLAEQIKKEQERIYLRVSQNLMEFIDDPKGHYHQRLLKPLLKNLFGLYDLMEGLETKALEIKSAEKHKKNYGLLRESLLRIFACHDIEVIIPKQGDSFTSAIHLAKEFVYTENQEEENTIDSCLRYGFLLQGALMRPAEVRVKKIKNFK